MNWEGKAILGGLGWALGGPFGGIIGGMIGHAMDSEESEAAAAQELQLKQQAFVLYALFGMAAKLAKADGVVSREEIDFLTAFMRNELELDPDTQKIAIEIFNAAKKSDTTMEEYATAFYDVFGSDAESLSSLLILLFQIAAADGVLHPKEEAMLHSVAQIFGLDESGFRQVKTQFFGDTDHWFALLECSPADSDATIKRQYKKLVLDYHPDKLAAQNLPAAILQLAQEKLQEINTAYAEIKKQRQFN